MALNPSPRGCAEPLGKLRHGKPRCAAQVRSLSGTISVEQRFLSPESSVRLRDLGTDPAATPRPLRAQVGALGGIWGVPGWGGAVLSPLFVPWQMDGMIFAAVREALGVLRGCK